MIKIAALGLGAIALIGFCIWGILHLFQYMGSQLLSSDRPDRMDDYDSSADWNMTPAVHNTSVWWKMQEKCILVFAAIVLLYDSLKLPNDEDD